MNLFTKQFVLGFCLFGVFGAPHNSYAQTRKPVIFTTPAQPLTAYLKQVNHPDLPLHGQAALTLAAARTDDTLLGTFVFALTEDSRKQLAESTHQPLSAIPALLSKKAVTAVFQKNTACPWLRLELNPAVLEVSNLQLYFKPIVLEVPETRTYLGQLLCHWVRQINVNRQRRGIIAAINRALSGEEEQ
jgi:hypothetical protein